MLLGIYTQKETPTNSMALTPKDRNAYHLNDQLSISCYGEGAQSCFLYLLQPNLEAGLLALVDNVALVDNL